MKRIRMLTSYTNLYKPGDFVDVYEPSDQKPDGHYCDLAKAETLVYLERAEWIVLPKKKAVRRRKRRGKSKSS